MVATNDTCQCRANGCTKTANRKGAGLCEAHYAKQRRHGDFNHVVQRPEVAVHSQGYLLQAAPGHPLTRGGLRAYQHRLVFHEAHGDGPFLCHWCSKQVTWGDMHVDHLNDVVTDNRIDNLVASCPGCNLHRNTANRQVSLRRRFGLTVDGVTRTHAEWAGAVGISVPALKARIAAGWPLHKAVNEPRGPTGPKPRDRRA